MGSVVSEDVAVQRVTAFLSYAGVDTTYAAGLTRSLITAGLDVWVDVEARFADNWRDAILPAIVRCDVFVFLVTVASVASVHCNLELQHAVRHGKRVVPVVLDPGAVLPPLLSDALRCRVSRDLQEGEVRRITEFATADTAHLKQHTRLAFLADGWVGDRHGLLDGAESSVAARWIEDTDRRIAAPAPTAKMRALVAASIDAARRRRARMRAVIAAGVAALALLAAAAVRSAHAVRDGLADNLAERAIQGLDRPELAALLAVEGYRTSPTPASESGLLRVRTRLGAMERVVVPAQPRTAIAEDFLIQDLEVADPQGDVVALTPKHILLLESGPRARVDVVPIDKPFVKVAADREHSIVALARDDGEVTFVHGDDPRRVVRVVPVVAERVAGMGALKNGKWIVVGTSGRLCTVTMSDAMPTCDGLRLGGELGGGIAHAWVEPGGESLVVNSGAGLRRYVAERWSSPVDTGPALKLQSVQATEAGIAAVTEDSEVIVLKRDLQVARRVAPRPEDPATVALLVSGGAMLAIGHAYGSIELYELHDALAPPRLLLGHAIGVNALAPWAGGFISGAVDGSVLAWAGAARSPVVRLVTPRVDMSRGGLDASPTAPEIALGDGIAARVIDLGTGKERCSRMMDGRSEQVRFSPDGVALAVVVHHLQQDHVHVLDSQTCDETFVTPEPLHAVNEIGFSSDRRLLLLQTWEAPEGGTGAFGGYIRTYDLSVPQPHLVSRMALPPPEHLDLHLGEQLAPCYDDSTVGRWDVKAGRVSGAAIPAPGASAATLGRGGKLLWGDHGLNLVGAQDATKPLTRCIAPLIDNLFARKNAWVHRIAVGDRFVAAARGGAGLLLCRATDMRFHAVLDAWPGLVVHDVVWSQPRGTFVLAASGDVTDVFEIDVQPERWAEELCSLANRNLSLDEWRESFVGRPYACTCPSFPAGDGAPTEAPHCVR